MTTAQPGPGAKGPRDKDADAKPDKDGGHLSPQIDERDSKVADGGRHRHRPPAVQRPGLGPELDGRAKAPPLFI